MKSGFQFQFSNSFKAKRKRIAHIPHFVDEIANIHNKKIAAKLIINFQTNLRLNKFKLKPLKEQTIKSKRRLQMRRPESPLYGLGDQDQNSLVNALRVKKKSTGRRSRYIVTPRRALHHYPVRMTKTGQRQFRRSSKRIPLAMLLAIHEHGAVIRRGAGVIVLPPRPALHLAFEMTLGQMKADKREHSRAIKQAITDRIMGSKQFRKVAEMKINVQEERALGNIG